jgi:hypothetical protein
MARMDTLITHPPFEYCVSYRVSEIRLRLQARGWTGKLENAGASGGLGVTERGALADT